MINVWELGSPVISGKGDLDLGEGRSREAWKWINVWELGSPVTPGEGRKQDGDRKWGVARSLQKPQLAPQGAWSWGDPLRSPSLG